MAVNPHTGELFTGSTIGTWVFPPPYESENLIYDKLVSYQLSVKFDAERRGRHSHAERGNENKPDVSRSHALRGNALPDAPRPATQSVA